MPTKKTNNDSVIKKLIAEVEKQRNDLGSKPKFVLETNGIYYLDGGEHYNINTLGWEGILKVTSDLIKRRSCYDDACELLGITDVPFVYNRYTFDEWITDFKNRLSLVRWGEAKHTLTNTEKKLKSLMSEDARTENELKDIKAALGL